MMTIIGLWWLWFLLTVVGAVYAALTDRTFQRKHYEAIANGADLDEKSITPLRVKIGYALTLFFAIITIVSMCLYLIDLFSRAITLGLETIFQV